MSPRQSSRYLITQSLLSSWQWGLALETGYEDFLKTLRREPIQQNKAMLEGIRFENVLNATLKGAAIGMDHEWYKPIMELYPTLVGSQQQVSASKDVTINGVPFVLYGKLDYLKAGIIYDTKYSKTYSVGKYLDSPQAPMYLSLIPEAREFQYKICDGKYIYTETYRPDEVEPIERTIKHFMDFLDKQDLIKTYYEFWKSKY
jgi:hypothetical protein